MATAPILIDDAGVEDDSAPAQDLRSIANLAHHVGDLSSILTAQELATIGNQVVEDYERDLSSRSEWEEAARKGLARAAQEPLPKKDYPWPLASNVNFPVLTIAAQQFNARAYPAICKSGAMVKVRVIGSDKGRPQIGPDGQPLVGIPGPNGQLVPVTRQQFAAMAAASATQPQSGPDGSQPAPGTQNAPQAAPEPPQPQPIWAIQPGAKTKRADRVSSYLNIYLEYRVKGWESDMDLLLQQVPIVGCGFKKLWWHEGRQCVAYISALDLIVPTSAKSLDCTPRITERIPDVYPYQIRQRQRAGEYRVVDLPSSGEDAEAPRLLLEQHRYLDLDEDGVDEPYIVTVDRETSEVLKIEANFGPDDVKMDDDKVIRIEKTRFYVKYPFLPHPKGEFYDIGFGHLLEQMGDIINSAINQMFDAGHAQIAGGGFIASGLRLQNSNRSAVLRWQPGHYVTVSASGNDLRAGIVERTFPNVSPIMFQLLEMMLGAAKEVTSVKDVVTGNAPNTAPVGTTLALIDQGMAVFTAIYKRIYRSLGEEYSLIYDNIGRYADKDTAEDYMNVLDDPEANFQADFGERDMDVKPFADPTSVTKMQQMAKAQFLAALKGQGLNDLEINKRILQAADIEDIDSILPPADAPPPPQLVAQLAKLTSETNKNNALADNYSAQAFARAADTGMRLGEADGGSGSEGLFGLAGSPGDEVGVQGAAGQG